MTIREIAAILEADVHAEDTLLDKELVSAFGSDMMSDVLAYANEHALLLTGLLNPQVVRTAHMQDMSCIVFVRGKRATEEILELAKACHIAILETKHIMYYACGLLYEHGLGR